METNEAAAVAFSLAYCVVLLVGIAHVISTSETWKAIKRWFSRKKDQ